jgi:hypothetical protein
VTQSHTDAQSQTHAHVLPSPLTPPHITRPAPPIPHSGSPNAARGRGAETAQAPTEAAGGSLRWSESRPAKPPLSPPPTRPSARPGMPPTILHAGLDPAAPSAGPGLHRARRLAIPAEGPRRPRPRRRPRRQRARRTGPFGRSGRGAGAGSVRGRTGDGGVGLVMPVAPAARGKRPIFQAVPAPTPLCLLPEFCDRPRPSALAGP